MRNRKISSLLLRLNSFLVFLAFLSVSGCSSTPPSNLENICSIFKEKPEWHRSAIKVKEKWGAPVHVPFAMMHQESRFVHNARPPRRYILGFVPAGRVSSAYGYSQALDATWLDYKKANKRSRASRDNFDDALDFMGWYIHRTYQINKISKWDARLQYLNYHEGWGGYQRGSYKEKQWLGPVATKVADRSKLYAKQYSSCKDNLSKGGWFW